MGETRGWGQAKGEAFARGASLFSQWFYKWEDIWFPEVDARAKWAFQKEGILRESGPAWMEFVFFKVGFELPAILDLEGRIPSTCLAPS